MTLEENLTDENTRADMYKLLSECYYSPDEKLIEKLGSLKNSREMTIIQELLKSIPTISDLDPVRDKMPQASVVRLRQTISNGVEQLKIDYSRLFLGPFKVFAPPYGSVYLEDGRKILGESTIDVKKWYRKEKLDILLKEAPDHIAVELEFMYFLIFKQIEAIKNSDSETANNYLKKQKSFLKIHLGEWVYDFAEKVESNAETEFYKALARLTRSFVEKDLTRIFHKVWSIHPKGR